MHTAKRIHINRQPFSSPSPTTGIALYALGNVPAGQDLFRETLGNREDDEVRRNDDAIHLTEDEHFYSVREFHIIVNLCRSPEVVRFCSAKGSQGRSRKSYCDFG